MYGIPKELDLSPIVGQLTTQFRVGQFDLQFTLGPVSFMVESPVTLFRDGTPFARWEGGRWPDSGFYDIMNVNVTRCEVPNNKLIVVEFENGITMHLEDTFDNYDSMTICFEDSSKWFI